MKSNKIYKVLFTFMFSIPIAYILILYILNKFNYTFTNFTTYALVKLLLIISIIILFCEYMDATDNSKSINIRFLSGLGTHLCVANIVLTLVIIFLGPIYTLPEHFVKKDGNNMIVHVYVSENVYAKYYNSKTIFIRDKNTKIEDLMEDTWCDPFTNKSAPKAKHTTYYDDNGYIIKSYSTKN